MKFLELEPAIRNIKQACDPETRQQKFFFMIGAGVSLPSVPLAREIIEDCKKRVAQFGATSAQAPTNMTSDEYSYWFQEAYAHRRDRQRYLRKLIERKPISHANLRLAHLLLEPKIANLVVTTNFDDFLSRALELFGKAHIVCDHPSTTERIDPEQNDVQIVHVHGSYWFYDCCNLKGEITERSQSSDQQMQTMAALLNRILSNRSPIVVGYSGWENDVFMKSLEQRLKTSLPYNLYWFLYRRPKLGDLPNWLCNHSDVYFVAPPEVSSERSKTEGGAMVAQAVSEKSGNERGLALPAERVFDEMIRAFKLEPPPLTQDPLKYFVDHLRGSLPDGIEQTDLYGLEAVIARIERAKVQDQQEVVLKSNPLEAVKNALRQSQYRKTIQIGVNIPIPSLDISQQKFLLQDLFTAAKGLFDDSEEELDAYRYIAELYDALPSPEMSLSLITCKALLYRGITLGTLGQSEAAISVYDELLNRFGNCTELPLQEQVANALVNKGIALGTLGQPKAEIAVYDELLDRFGNRIELPLQEQVADALFNKGIALGNLGPSEAAIAVYNELLDRFGNRTELPLQEQVADALFNKGVALGDLDQSEAEIAVYDEVINRFSNRTELSLQERVAKALVRKGVTLGTLGQFKAAIAVYDELLDRFGNRIELPLQERVAGALFNKGVTLGTLGQFEAEIAVYDEVINRFINRTELPLQERVAKALINKGVALGTLGQFEAEIAVCDKVINRFSNSLEPSLQEQVAKAIKLKGQRL